MPILDERDLLNHPSFSGPETKELMDKYGLSIGDEVVYLHSLAFDDLGNPISQGKFIYGISPEDSLDREVMVYLYEFNKNSHYGKTYFPPQYVTTASNGMKGICGINDPDLLRKLHEYLDVGGYWKPTTDSN